MLRGGGAPPEELSTQSDLEVVRKTLKNTGRELKKIDGPKKKLHLNVRRILGDNYSLSSILISNSVKP
jgi:hypothetical protein